MDKFVVDLDKVLDDLEFDEDQQCIPGAGKGQLLEGTMENPYSVLNEAVVPTSPAHGHITKSNSVDSKLSYDSPYVATNDPYVAAAPINLADADFGPSPPKATLLDLDVFSSAPSLQPFVLQASGSQSAADIIQSEAVSTSNVFSNYPIQGDDQEVGQLSYKTDNDVHCSGLLRSDNVNDNTDVIGIENGTVTKSVTSTDVSKVLDNEMKDSSRNEAVVELVKSNVEQQEKFYTHAGIASINALPSKTGSSDVWGQVEASRDNMTQRQEPIGQDNSPKEFAMQAGLQHFDVNSGAVSNIAAITSVSDVCSQPQDSNINSLAQNGVQQTLETTTVVIGSSDARVSEMPAQSGVSNLVQPDSIRDDSTGALQGAGFGRGLINQEVNQELPTKEVVGFGDVGNTAVTESTVDDYLGDVDNNDDIMHVQLGSQSTDLSQDTLALLDPFLSQPAPVNSCVVTPVDDSLNKLPGFIQNGLVDTKIENTGALSVNNTLQDGLQDGEQPGVGFAQGSSTSNQGSEGISNDIMSSNIGVGARPKEPSQSRRPNSLLGLSTVALEPSPTRRQHSPQIGNELVSPPEKSNDVINRQLAEASKSTLLKKQMNFEIKNQMQHEVFAEDPMDNRFMDLPVNAQPSSLASPITEQDNNETSSGKQKRPSSLNIPSRIDRNSDDSTEGNNEGEPMTVSPGQEEAPESSEDSIQQQILQQQQPRTSSQPTDQTQAEAIAGMDRNLGKVAPVWVPDADAPSCMACQGKFTFTKRRHHCRSCGKVFCNGCCKMKMKLDYLDSKEGRVCNSCFQTISTLEALDKLSRPVFSPNPNNPAEYCSTISPYQQAQPDGPLPTVMVPVVGVLKREGSQKRESKSVMFSDGIRPGGDLTELDATSNVPYRKSSGRSHKKVERQPPDGAGAPENGEQESTTTVKTRTVKVGDKNNCLIPEQGLPPVVSGPHAVAEGQNAEKLMQQLKNEDSPAVVFAVNKNLFVLVKIINLDCCVNRTCWCFTTKGLCTVGQEEMIIVLECLPDENEVPRDVFVHFNKIYQDASKGIKVSHMGHSIVTQPFLGSRDHCGFLYIRTTFQCLQKLILPEPPYIFGILLQKWETPWAKVFPLRLLLRLGAEYRYYPCPVISVRHRRPVYCEVGHTIMNLLADFRNFQYMLPQIGGVTIHMQDKKTYINFPRNRYDEVTKVINSCNDHVIALSANFSTEADSHLVCIQNDEGNYQTQAINIQNKPRKVTGASFVVFNGALKTSSGLSAKSSIVEDGLMVQITAETMTKLKQAVHDMTDITINCGPIDAVHYEETVQVQWTDDDKSINVGVRSPIDGKPMDGIVNIHIHNATDFIGEHHTIRWTEVFFIHNQDDGHHDPIDLSRLAEMLASACCIALTPHLDKMKEAGLTKIGLRCNIDSDCVGYEVGAGGSALPPYYMTDLDNEMIPVIHNAASQSHSGPVIMELIFHIIA